MYSQPATDRWRIGAGRFSSTVIVIHSLNVPDDGLGVLVADDVAEKNPPMLSVALSGAVSTAALAHRAAHTRGTFPTG